jgi:cytochrome c553
LVQITAFLTTVLATLAVGAASAAPLGKTIAEQGDGKSAPPCNSCHGARYQGNPAIKAPAIAGLSRAYILARLAHYASPAGKNPSMKAVATALTPAESQAVATYLSTLPKPAPQAR